MDPQLQSPSDSSSVPAEVRGWLLALCLIRTIVFPATSLYRIISHAIPTAIAAHTNKPQSQSSREAPAPKRTSPMLSALPEDSF
jgi:hypothetical protein